MAKISMVIANNVNEKYAISEAVATVLGPTNISASLGSRVTVFSIKPSPTVYNLHKPTIYFYGLCYYLIFQ